MFTKCSSFTVVILVLIYNLKEINSAVIEKVLETSEIKALNKKNIDKECIKSYSATCFKLDLVRWLDKLDAAEDFTLLPGVRIVRDKSENLQENKTFSELARQFPDNPHALLDGYLLKKMSTYLKSHSLKFNLFDAKAAEDIVSARKGEGLGGGKGGKKGGGMGMLLAAAAMMKGTLMALALGAISALAGKALMAGLAALMLSAIFGLKSLTSGGHKTTYEVVSKPVVSTHHSYSEEHSQGHGHGYGHRRSYEIPLPEGVQPDYKPYPNYQS